MKRVGNFIVIGGTWLNVERIVSAVPGMKEIVNKKDLEVEIIPDGLDITLTTGKDWHVAEEYRKDFLTLLEKAAYDWKSVTVEDIGGTIEVANFSPLKISLTEADS